MEAPSNISFETKTGQIIYRQTKQCRIFQGLTLESKTTSTTNERQRKMDPGGISTSNENNFSPAEKWRIVKPYTTQI